VNYDTHLTPDDVPDVNHRPQRERAGNSVEKKTYIGLSSTATRTSIAIVSSNGDILFAESSLHQLEGNDGLTTGRLASLIDRYCDPEAEVVLALTQRPRVISRTFDSDRGPPRFPLLDSKEAKKHIPGLLRAALAASAYTSWRQDCNLSELTGRFEYELASAQKWAGVKCHKTYYDHHLSHAAAACFTAPHPHGICVVLDGSEPRPCTCYVYRDGTLYEIDPVKKPAREASLGSLYRDVCDACGFRSMLREHWKVTRLADYGELDPSIYGILRTYVATDGLSFCGASDDCIPALYEQIDALSRKIDQPAVRAANLAYAGQAVFEDVLYTFLRDVRAMTLRNDLVFTGGCALNSAANGKIIANTGFSSLHVPFAPSNDGNAVGSALLAYHDDTHSQSLNRRRGIQTPFLGSEISGKNRLVGKDASYCISVCNGDAPQRAAGLLAQGKLVAWIQGRAEFGQRSLGNRSVLADPRRTDIKELHFIDSAGNYCDDCRSFGVSILHEYGAEYFDNYQVCPYMDRGLRFRLKAARRLPAAVSRNGTTEVQTVKRDWNERFYDLIFSFYRITGVPFVINISYATGEMDEFRTLSDVLNVFNTSRIDAMFVDNVLLLSDRSGRD
jgi:carbamoyltransferase